MVAVLEMVNFRVENHFAFPTGQLHTQTSCVMSQSDSCKSICQLGDIPATSCSVAFIGVDGDK